MTPRRILAATAAAAALLAAAPAFATLPTIDSTVTGPAGDNGWYVGPVTVKWTLLNETASLGCDTRTLTGDTAGTEIACTAFNGPAQVTASIQIRIDQTAPAGVTAAAARAPDAGSWFTAPVAIAWSGKDALSGIAWCTALTYAGPDAAGAAPTGTCRDLAGNVSAPVAFALDYDATPPALGDVTATAAAGRADIRWAAGADAVRVTVVRDGAAPHTVADGPTASGSAADSGLAPATTYSWTVTAFDAAGNATARSATATTPPPPGPHAVRLHWRSAHGASYYNVQVFRGHRKVLSAWPADPRFKLATHWRFRGRTQRLVMGRTYRWYAWAGFGPRSARRYGRLLAHGRFRVR